VQSRAWWASHLQRVVGYCSMYHVVSHPCRRGMCLRYAACSRHWVLFRLQLTAGRFVCTGMSAFD
jgi:hypothetical protein